MKLTDRFRYRTVIDWIELVVMTATPTNFWTLKRLLGLTFVEGINEGGGRATTEFKFRVYDVKNWKQLDDAIINLSEDIKLASEPIITAIEVSLDAFSKSNSTTELQEHTGEMVRMLSNPITSQRSHRAAGGFRGSAEQLWLKSGKYFQVTKRSFYFGNQKDDGVSMRIYWKHTDKGMELPIQEHVSRVEVTLKGENCPFKTIEEAKRYQFQNLSSWFKFRKVKEGLNGLNKLIVDANTQVGRRGGWRVRAENNKKVSYRVSHPLTIANTELNEIAYEKLRQLTKRLSKRRAA